MDAVVLKNGLWQAKIQPDYGMNLFSVQYDGREIMRPCEGRQMLESRKHLYGFPLIMPANRTKDGRFTFQGREYSLPVNEVARGNNLHGRMADVPFAVVEQTDRRLVGRFENRGERYPFAFDMTIEVEVQQDCVRQTMRIKALENMPYTFGLHATFARPQKYDVPRGRQCVWDAEHFIPTGEWIDPPLPLGETFDTCFAMSGRTALLDDVVFTVSDNFDHWVMYNGDGKQDFLCVEPQSGQVNGLNIPGGHRVLAAGEEDTFWFTLTLQK
ncbi:MAG: aldose 1-epimerase [Oscillospiraceae bacterium]|nr:aldose 1-epimerase [Oscillospiraceae bacterium]